MTKILVVEDDPIQRRLLVNIVEQLGYEPLQAENGLMGLDILARQGSSVRAVLLDLMMPEMDGQTFLETTRQYGYSMPIIVQTGQGGIDTVVKAMQAGAFDFVVKPLTPERVSVAIGNALKLETEGAARKHPARRGRGQQVSFDDIVSASPAMLRVLDLGRRAAQSNIPVVLEGESGVGKEMVARAIQSSSERAPAALHHRQLRGHPAQSRREHSLRP